MVVMVISELKFVSRLTMAPALYIKVQVIAYFKLQGNPLAG